MQPPGWRGGSPGPLRTARRLPRERLPRAEPWSGGSPDPIPNSAVKPHLAESTAAPGRGRTGRSARRGRFLRSGRPDGTAGPADAAAPAGARPRPLFGARRGAEAARPRGGAIPGACRTLADFLGRTCATKTILLFWTPMRASFLFLCALNREMGTASFFENIRTRIMFSGKLASMTEPKGSSGKGGFP